jgi:hypothetical protein
MNVRDWVFFKTRNWPKDVRATKINSKGRTEDVTGQGLYEGRGKIVGIVGNNITVREEKTNRSVEVGPHPEDVIRSLAFKYAGLTLGNLRAFLETYKDAPDDVPLTIALPLGFFSDEDDIPPDHPEYKAVSASEAVEAVGISFMAFSESGAVTEGYILPEERGNEKWEFCIELSPNDEQCYQALRERGDE